jgi:hypothetical protein
MRNTGAQGHGDGGLSFLGLNLGTEFGILGSGGLGIINGIWFDVNSHEISFWSVVDLPTEDRVQNLRLCTSEPQTSSSYWILESWVQCQWRKPESFPFHFGKSPNKKIFLSGTENHASCAATSSTSPESLTKSEVQNDEKLPVWRTNTYPNCTMYLAGIGLYLRLWTMEYMYVVSLWRTTERIVGLHPTIKGKLRNPAIRCAIRTGSSFWRYCALFWK